MITPKTLDFYHTSCRKSLCSFFCWQEMLFPRPMTYGCPGKCRDSSRLDPAFAVEDVAVHTFENAVKVQCMVIPDPDIVSFYRRQEMQVRGVPPALFRSWTGEAFIRYNDAFPDIIVPDKRSVGTGINAVAGKDLGAYRFHFLYVISIENRNFLQPRTLALREKAERSFTELLSCLSIPSIAM